MPKVFLIVPILLIHTALGAQIDVKDCYEVIDITPKPHLRSKASGNKVQLGVLKPNNFDLQAAKESGGFFSLTQFLDEDLTESEENEMLFHDMSLFKSSKVWVKGPFVDGTKVEIMLPDANSEDALDCIMYE